jgi:hypothetical protein
MATRAATTTCAWMVLMVAVPAVPAHAQEPAGPPGARHEPPGGRAVGASVPDADLDHDTRADGALRTKPWSRGVPKAQREQARALFLEGNRYLDVPLFAQAAEKYLEALTLWAHPAFHFNLALAQLNLVQPVEAYESFGRALTYAPDGIAEDKQRLAQDYRQRLERQLGRIEVTCEQPGVAVTMDGPAAGRAWCCRASTRSWPARTASFLRPSASWSRPASTPQSRWHCSARRAP